MSDKSDISSKSSKHNHVAVARTPVRRGLICFSFEPGQAPGQADLLILRGPDGFLVPARFAGFAKGDLTGDGAWSLVEMYAVDPSGTAITSILGDATAATDEALGHDWGALGLPKGPSTRVRALADHRDDDFEDDIESAFSSQGYSEYSADRRLSIGAGDKATVSGRVGTIIAVDRRKRTAEILFGEDDSRQVVDFDDIAELEPNG